MSQHAFDRPSATITTAGSPRTLWQGAGVGDRRSVHAWRRGLAAFAALLALACQEGPTAPDQRAVIPASAETANGSWVTLTLIEVLSWPAMTDGGGNAINNANQISGYAIVDGIRRPFRWTPPNTWELMAAPGNEPIDGPGFENDGLDINDGGQVVGYAYTAVNGGSAPARQAARWITPGQYELLTGDVPGEGRAHAINVAGHAAGFATDPTEAYAVQWLPDGSHEWLYEMQGADTLGRIIGGAWGINDQGDVVGHGGHVPADLDKPFLWQQGPSFAHPTFTRLPTPPGMDRGTAYAINGSGTIVGISWSSNSAAREAVRWPQPTVAQPLGMLPGHAWSEATDINEGGVIVGTSHAVNDEDRGFRITPSGSMAELGLPFGAYYTHARGINDYGHVVGVVLFPGAIWRPVVWWIYPSPYILDARLMHPFEPIVINGTITIDILSDARLTATDIDPAVLTLGDGAAQDVGVMTVRGRPAVDKGDFNDDGMPDLRVRFSASELIERGEVDRAGRALLHLKGALHDRSSAVHGTTLITFR